MEHDENVADPKECEGILSLVHMSGADVGFDPAFSRYDQVLMPSPG